MSVFNIQNSQFTNNAINLFVSAINKIKNNLSTIAYKIFDSFYNKEQVFAKALSDYKIVKTEISGIKQVEHPNFEVDSTSSIIFNKNSHQFVYISPAPPIKNVVMSGGGAKGVVIPGVLKAFEEHKIGNRKFIEQIESFAGSSVGAINSSFAALGGSSNNITSIMQKENFHALLGKGKGPLFKDGKPLLNCMRKNYKRIISAHVAKMGSVNQLKGIGNIRLLVINQLKKQDKVLPAAEVDKLVNEMEHIINVLKNQKIDKIIITFAMLKTLRKLDPQTFKDLTVTATCRETGKICYFNADNTPHLDIALACRASASLPFILKPVTVDPCLLLPKYVFKTPKSFVDGGYLDNVPVAAVEKKQGKNHPYNKGEEGQNLQTLVLVFDGSDRKADEQSPFHEAVCKQEALFNCSSLLNRLLRDIIPTYIGRIRTKERHTLTKEKKLHEIRTKYTQRNIALHISLKTTDFVKAKQNEAMYIEQGYKQGMEYLTNHAEELIYRSFDTLEELMKYMPKKIREKKKIALEEFEKECFA